MSLALVAVPLVVLVEDLWLLELIKAVINGNFLLGIFSIGII
jgi:hypothetical protein